MISEYTNLKKLLVVGREERSILQDSVNCVLHIRIEVKLNIFVNSAFLRFTKGLVSRIPFSGELLDYVHAVSEFSFSGA